MPLILVQNEVTADPAHDWNDVEGVHYHYPSKYRNKIVEGERFVYYIGVHRADGRRRPHGEYFGTGTIGQIWEDPESPRSWYCAIEDYERFAVSVPAKIDGESIENGPPNMWRDGVRVADSNTFNRILRLAQSDFIEDKSNPSQSDVATAKYRASSVVVPGRKRPPSASTNGKKPTKATRYSRRSKQIGDWGEALAMRYIAEQLKGVTDIVHREAMKERPGWDIDYVDADGVLQRVEVKSTTGAAFSSIMLTANELEAAQQYGNNYTLMLIAGCETEAPKIELFRDPYRLILGDKWQASPATYNVILSDEV